MKERIYAEKTIVDYENFYNKIISKLPENYQASDILNATSHLAKSTQNKYLSAFIYHKKQNNEDYDELLAAQRKFRNDYVSDYAKKEEEIIPWTDIVAKGQSRIDKYSQIVSLCKCPWSKSCPISTQDIIYTLEEAAIASLYINNPPMRLMEYFGSKYKTITVGEMINQPLPTVTENTVFSNGEIMLINYKTTKQYGEKKLMIDRLSIDIINTIHAHANSVTLFPSFYTQSQAFNIIQKIFGTTTSGLRKSYITYHVPNMDRAERISLTKIMGHSLVAQELNYNKNNTISETKTNNHIPVNEEFPIEITIDVDNLLEKINELFDE